MTGCAFNHCRGEAATEYLGRDLCPRCWRRLCEAGTHDERLERILLRELGLARVNGEVVDADDPARIDRVADAIIDEVTK